MRGAGPECPNDDCGGVNTPVVTSGKDTQSRMLRKRRCQDCLTVFVTVESVVLARVRHGGTRLALFSEVDDTHQERSSRAKRERNGWTRFGQGWVNTGSRRRKPHQISGGMSVKTQT